MTKPVVAYIAGLSAPKGRQMGHAGAIVSAAGDSAQEKVESCAPPGSRWPPTRPAWARPWPRVLAEHGLARRSV